MFCLLFDLSFKMIAFFRLFIISVNSVFIIVQIQFFFLKLRLTCQNDMYLSGFWIHFLDLFYFLYVLLLAKTCASHVSFPNVWGLATLMKFK